MKDFKIKHFFDEFDYTEDVQRIIAVLNNKGYNCSKDQAKALWCEYSDSMCGTWLVLPDDDEDLYERLLGHMVEL